MNSHTHHRSIGIIAVAVASAVVMSGCAAGDGSSNVVTATTTVTPSGSTGSGGSSGTGGSSGSGGSSAASTSKSAADSGSSGSGANADAIAGAEASGMTVVTGTVYAGSQTELTPLIGIQPANPEDGSLYAVVLLDQPVTLTGTSAPGETRTESTSVVVLARLIPGYAGMDRDYEAWSPYDGQQVTVALEDIAFPTDTSYPTGAPGAGNALVLENGTFAPPAIAVR